MTGKRLAFAAVTLLCAAFGAARAGADSPQLFVPPPGWQSMQAMFVPSLPVTWTDGRSSLALTRVTVPLPFGETAKEVEAEAAANGTVLRTREAQVCGAPAQIIDVAPNDPKFTLTRQFQTIAGASFFFSYRRPAGVAADPVVETMLAHFCGPASVDAWAPPPGWLVHHLNVLGTWVGSATDIMSAVQTERRADPSGLARETLTATLRTANVEILSQNAGTLCGSPALFFTARAKRANLPDVSIAGEVAQSPAAAYVLSATYALGGNIDPAADDALKTLCVTADGATAAPAPSHASPAAHAPPASQAPGAGAT